MFRRKKPSFTNWVTRPDGTIEQSPVVIRKGGIVDGIYEVEVLDGAIGVALETDFYGQHTIVKNVDVSRCDPAIQETMAEGHVLVAINNRHVINEEFEDVISFLTMLRTSGVSRKMRFLDPSKCPVAVYEEKISLQMKSEKDMYGFLRSAEYIEVEREGRLTTSQAVAKRDLAWVHYLKAIGGAENLKPGGVFKPSYPLKMLVRRGVPAAYRSLVWKHISMSNQYRLAHPRGCYAGLVDRINEDLSAKVRDDIDKDLLRTFPDHDYFRSGRGLASLCRVLSAYALHNPEVAYCQSLNFIAGTVLLYLEEEDGFWLLCALLDYLLPVDQYSRSMIGTYVDQAVLGHIVKTRFPVLHRKLEEFQLDLSIVSMQWFMCLFVNTLRTETALRVWDVLLNEGDKVLFRVAASLLHIHEADIEAAGDAAALHNCLKDMGSSITNADMLLAQAYKDFDDAFDPVQAAAPPSSPSLFARPSSWSRKIMQLRQVPPQLEGIGVGHRGPVTQDSQSSASQCSAAAESSEAGAAVNKSSTASEYTSYPSLALDPASARVHFQEIIARKKKKHRQGSSERSVEGLRRIRNEDFHRAFSRGDISIWRHRYRPAVEGAIAQMETNRKQWRSHHELEGDVEDVDIGYASELKQETAKEGSEGRGNSLADTEEVSTVSTVGDDSGADGSHEDSGMEAGLKKTSEDEVGEEDTGSNNAPC